MEDVERREPRWPDLWAVRQMSVSYAQNFEDTRLARAFPEGEGFYLDVGAFEPVFLSPTKLFYDRGWRGVNVEPQPAVFARLAADRPRDVNLNVGVSDRPGTLVFYETPASPELSSFDVTLAVEERKLGAEVIQRLVPVVTLAEVCERHVGPGRTIDFLKVDAEGFDRAVLDGGDWDRWRPRVVLIEEPFPCDRGAFLEGVGYAFAAFDGINRFYVRDEDRALIPDLARPITAMDSAIPYTFLRLIEEKADLGPNAVALARRLRALSARFPALKAAALRLLRPAG